MTSRKEEEEEEEEEKEEEEGGGEGFRRGSGGVHLRLEQPVCREKLDIKALQSFRSHFGEGAVASSAPYPSGFIQRIR
jgi:hypothetical protein